MERTHATRYVLTANFRCTAPIIAAANALITQIDDRSKQDEHEQGRVDPARQGQDTPPVTIITYDGGPFGERPRLATATAMAWVADRISQWLTLDGIAPQEIAVLARTWDHLARVQQELRYRQIPITRMRVRERRDRMSGLMQTLPAQHWIQDLRRTRNQRFISTVASLLDTMCATWGHRGTEPSVAALRHIATEIDQERIMSGTTLTPITGTAILTSLFDAQIDPAADDGAGVVLSSLHAVKGREFRKVVLLLRGDWLDQDDERRLFYVGMTRARDELLLVAEDDHDALDEIGLPVTMALDVPTESDGPHFYHTECSLRDVQLGHDATIAEQERIQQLREGDPLNLIPGPRGRWNITAADGTVIGGLSKLPF